VISDLNSGKTRWSEEKGLAAAVEISDNVSACTSAGTAKRLALSTMTIGFSSSRSGRPKIPDSVLLQPLASFPVSTKKNVSAGRRSKARYLVDTSKSLLKKLERQLLERNSRAASLFTIPVTEKDNHLSIDIKKNNERYGWALETGGSYILRTN
jgi:hypothetical protein